ncbi:hypothetical protein [Streptomyces chromofuscus]|uniref:Lipoprotein n=1 Tax=Streptomyces chromofuscus TaxID=42881 RepID=A0A7M2TIX7_STRCW|nr:hypothetical protein [Streptomyces chromofuscus]QOV47893.1 hypothetical protein IPT68_18760 [Streptomyces chromofuscus]GGS87153.1 hypothetical protein GCM10010254_03690 [Streptomyces chromofuscus]
MKRPTGMVVLGVALSTALLACGAVLPHDADVPSYDAGTPSYDGKAPSASGEPSGTASASASASADPSWAGSRAGEGRMRPGRPEEPWPGTATAHPSGTGAEVPASPSASDPGAGADEDAQQAVPGSDASGPVLRVLPLGSGLVLIGLGLGIAFVALRVRRAQE